MPLSTNITPKSSMRPTADVKKSVVRLPSRMTSPFNELEGAEETEIAAQIHLPEEGGWGWVVVICAFFSILILDGVAFTFGSLLEDITKDLCVAEALVALINSIAISVYFIAGPIVSAFINRFGFRACTMSGSIICSFSLFTAYFSTSYTTLCIFYGVFLGFGFSLINLSSGLVVGFYFEKLRAVALTITSIGSSIGVMTFFPLNLYLVQLGGWRLTTLFHSGLFGIIFFLAMSFRPLLALTVIKANDDRTRTVTYLPHVSTAHISHSRTKANVLAPTATEKLFGAVSNYNFPTAAEVVHEDESVMAAPGPSTALQSRLTIKPDTVQGTVSRRQLKQVQSIMSRANADDQDTKKVEVSLQVEEPKEKRSFWARLCHWERHNPHSRPLYRDDAFYEGKIENLPEYQKTLTEATSEKKTGLEYQLAVSRAVTVVDMSEQRGVFTTAVRRVLATMMDPVLLKKCSFIILCLSGFLTYLGFLVPYVYLRDRNIEAGIEEKHCALFVSTIGLANAIGRIVLGILAYKLDPVYLSCVSCGLAGVATCLSHLSFDPYYQYAYCGAFGFFISSVSCLRSIMLVSLYGLEKLTNAMGMMIMFQGIGSLLSTPIAATVKNFYGYDYAFIVAGIFLILSSIVVIPLRHINNKEKRKKEKCGVLHVTLPPVPSNVLGDK